MGITQHLAAEVPDIDADATEGLVLVNDGHGFFVLHSTHALA